ncbi:MAG: hypothetical protein HPY67_07340 [Syntrophaceae bacterium]|nr:hypothetical protein [Syntrophaceae bacterium]
MFHPLLPTEGLLRPAVHVLVCSGPGPADPEIGSFLEAVYPETLWRLSIHEAVSTAAAVSLMQDVRVHLAILLTERLEVVPPPRGAIGPASALGLIRILKAAWNVPVVAVAGSTVVDPGRREEILACGADCVVQRPRQLWDIRLRVEAMTSVFYSRDRLEVAPEVPVFVKNQLRRWDGIAAVAYECFRRYGRVVIGVEGDEADPGAASFTAITCNPFGGWPDRRVQQMVLCYDPECEIVVRFTDLTGRVRTERLRTGPEGNSPRKAHKIGLLNDTLRTLRVGRKTAPVG